LQGTEQPDDGVAEESVLCAWNRRAACSTEAIPTPLSVFRETPIPNPDRFDSARPGDRESIEASGQPEPARTSERLLIQSLTDRPPKLTVQRVLCTSLGRAQLAAAIALTWPGAEVLCNFLDLYHASLARQSFPVKNLRIACEPDDPIEPSTLDLAVFPLAAHGDAELTRERLQAAHFGLRPGGQLWVATDNPRDRWLRSELEKLFDRVRITAMDDGVVYHSVKTSELKKRKDFTCWFAFRDDKRLLQLVTRPGVFSHRHLDIGARCLMETMTLPPGARVLELGCGAGAVACAAAARAPGIRVLALDSNPRAIQCTRWSAEANQLDAITTKLDADAQSDAPGEYDHVLANPPYYSHQRISRLFIDGATRALRPGGTLAIVTKDANWYLSELPKSYRRIEVLALRSYVVVRAARV
jgi:16S rRNA G1207 methylase RsmC